MRVLAKGQPSGVNVWVYSPSPVVSATALFALAPWVRVYYYSTNLSPKRAEGIRGLCTELGDLLPAPDGSGLLLSISPQCEISPPFGKHVPELNNWGQILKPSHWPIKHGTIWAKGEEAMKWLAFFQEQIRAPPNPLQGEEAPTGFHFQSPRKWVLVSLVPVAPECPVVRGITVVQSLVGNVFRGKQDIGVVTEFYASQTSPRAVSGHQFSHVWNGMFAPSQGGCKLQRDSRQHFP